MPMKNYSPQETITLPRRLNRGTDWPPDVTTSCRNGLRYETRSTVASDLDLMHTNRAGDAVTTPDRGAI
jgi:hypothetical protein